MSLSRRKFSLGAALVAVSLACSGAWAADAPSASGPEVQFTTSLGPFTLALYPDAAPKTVANFLRYVREGHYDGTIFHRVIPGFMVQGGGYDAQYAQKPVHAPIAIEAQQAYAHGLRNTRGMVAMARTSDPNSATAQFFINVADNAALDPAQIPAGDPVPVFTWQGRTYHDVPRRNLVDNPQLAGYTVFARVVQGMDTVDKIAAVKTGAGGPFRSDVPRTPVVIESARVL